MSTSQKKQLYDKRKIELRDSQKKTEQDHLQILKTQAEHDMVDFRQKMLHEKQGIEKQLLQEVGRCQCYYNWTTFKQHNLVAMKLN
jgi:hypothetical protein